MEPKITLRRSWPVALVVALGVLAWQAWGQAEITVQGHARVVDGDSLDIDNKPIRLYGIDAPELAQACRSVTREPYPCGDLAWTALHNLVSDLEPLDCEGMGIDRYGRLLAVCWATKDATRDPASSINAITIRIGHAVRDLDRAGLFWREEQAAREDQLNLWGSYFELPSDYRKRTRTGERAPTLDELRELMREDRPEA